MLSDTEKFTLDKLVSGLSERIDTRWSADKCVDLISSDDAFSAFDKEIGIARDSLRDISALLEGVLCNIKARFQQAIARATSHRNRVPHINRLPVEILRVIFQSVSSHGMYHTKNITLMTVCAHWRSVVVGDAKMWMCLNVNRVDEAYAAKAVERNRSLPLTISGCNGFSVERWVLELTAANLGRVKWLELDIDEDDWMEPEGCFERAQASILTHLRLRGEDIHYPCHPLLTLPLPSLRSLDLFNCCYPWNTRTPTNLTSLKIEVETYDANILSYFPDGDVAAVVRECPNLKHLAICFEDQSVDGEVMLPVQETEMRNLRSLELKLPEQYLVYLMRSVVLPPTLGVLRITAWQSVEPTTVAALFRSHRIPDALFSTIASLSTSVTAKDKYALQGFKKYRKNRPSLEVDFELLEPSLEADIGHPCTLLLSAIREQYSLPNLKCVTLGGAREGAEEYAGDWPSYTTEMALFMIHNPTITDATFDIDSECLYAKSLDEISDTLSEAVVSRGAWPLPNLASCSFTAHGSCDRLEYCDPCTAGILRFLNLVTSHKPLTKLAIRCGEIYLAERRPAVDFIRGIRALRIPHVWWSKTYFNLDEVPGEVTAGDLWPRCAEYDWHCVHDLHHRYARKSVVNCCRGRNPRTAYDYCTAHKAVDMYDIARDWASLLVTDSDDTVVQSDI